MDTIRGVIGGTIGGVVGAAVWAGVVYFTGYEIGWIAWGLGALVGFLFARGCPVGGSMAGILAAGITIASIGLGKYTAVELTIQQELGTEEEVIEEFMAEVSNDEFVISYLADEVIAERVDRGEVIQWPEDADPETASAAADYPPAIWAEAAQIWEAMSPQDREVYRAELAETVTANIQEFYGSIAGYGFLGSFGLMDLLFFGLAIVTAFQIASRGSTSSEPVETLHEPT